MRGGVIGKLNVTQAKMVLHRMILRCGKLAMKFMRANVGRVLIAHTSSVEGFIRNSDGIFAGLGGRFPDGEGVFPNVILGLKTNKLHDDAGFGHSKLKNGFSCNRQSALVRRLYRKKGRAGICRPALM
jgi:hypothetical protein